MWFQALRFLALAALAQPVRAQPATSPPTAAQRIQGRLAIEAPPAARRHWVRYGESGFLLFQGVVAGREAWALLDTGLGHSTIDAGLARAAGLTVTATSARVRTPTGSLPMAIARDVTFVIPDHLTVRMTHASAVDLSALSNQLGRTIGFIIGQDVLSQVNLLVNPASRSFYIARPDEVSMAPGTRSVAISGTQFTLAASVGDHPLTLLLDLGHNGVIGLKPEIWDRVAPPDTATSDGQAMGAEGVSHVIRTGRFPGVTLGPLTVRNVPVSRREISNIEADGIVGMGLFREMGFALDAPAGRLWFVPPAELERVTTPSAPLPAPKADAH